MNLENGAVINQYKILSPIGKGGMGEVYLAEDTKLNRRVALKFLSVSVSFVICSALSKAVKSDCRQNKN